MLRVSDVNACIRIHMCTVGWIPEFVRGQLDTKHHESLFQITPKLYDCHIQMEYLTYRIPKLSALDVCPLICCVAQGLTWLH